MEFELEIVKAGEGPGNFGHAGRPGQVGGSAPDSTPSPSTPTTGDIVQAHVIVGPKEIKNNIADLEKQIESWEGADRQAIGGMALINIAKGAKEGMTGFAMKESGKLVAITALQEKKGTDYIKVRDLSSNKKGYGHKMMIEVAKIAAAKGKWVALTSGTPAASKFYEHIGMTKHPTAPSVYTWTNDNVKEIARMASGKGFEYEPDDGAYVSSKIDNFDEDSAGQEKPDETKGKMEFRLEIKSSSKLQTRQRLWRIYIRRQAYYERKMTKWLRTYFRDQGKAVAGHVKFFLGGIVEKGGEGSGNFGHEGIPGHLGGSAPAGEGGVDKPGGGLPHHNILVDMGWKYKGTEVQVGWHSLGAPKRTVQVYWSATSKAHKIYVAQDGSWAHRRGYKLYSSGKDFDSLARHLDFLKKYPPIKGGPGSGSWEGPGDPRFAHEGSSGEGNSSDLGKLGEKLSSDLYASFSGSKNRAGEISSIVSGIASNLGIKVDTKIMNDASFNDRFKNAKMSEEGRLLGGAGAITAVYDARNNEACFRNSQIDKISSKGNFRLFMNSLFHEMGHAYHANVLGVKTQDANVAYGAGWAERFADEFSSILGWKYYTGRVLANPSGYGTGIVDSAKEYNFEEDFKARIGVLTNELKNKKSFRIRIKPRIKQKEKNIVGWIDENGIVYVYVIGELEIEEEDPTEEEEERGFIELVEKGGEGSGNFGHSGRPRQVGGSGGEGGGSSDSAVSFAASSYDKETKDSKGIREQVNKELSKLPYEMYERQIAGALKGSNVAVRVNENSLVKILEEGRLKTIHEGVQSSGWQAPQKRIYVEEGMFGVPRDAPPADRPIYGYVTLSRGGELSQPEEPKDGNYRNRYDPYAQYGNVALVLKTDISTRTTVVGGDSLNYRKQVIPSSLSDVKLASFRGFYLHDPKNNVVKKEVSQFIKEGKQNGAFALEAQVWGGVKVKDISEVVFRQTPSDKIKDQLSKYDISFRVVSTKKIINDRILTKAPADWQFPFKDWNKRLQDEAEDFLEELYDDYGTEVLKLLYSSVPVAPELMVSFDVTNPNVQEFLKGYTMKFAQGVNGTVESRLRNSLSEGIDAGESIRDLTGRVTDQYSSIEKYSAERIARTETVRATNMAAEWTYEQSGMVEKKEWLVANDERLCPFCESLDGETRPVDELFFEVGDVVVGTNGKDFEVSYEDVSSPPLHPNCRCAILPVVVEAPPEEEEKEEEEERGFAGPVEKGGEGSGNFGHASVPGRLGGSAPAGEGGSEMSGTAVVDGKRVAADGSPLPGHIQDLYIPPGWTDVKYNPDPDGELLAKGKDAAGRDQYVYSKKFVEGQAAEKFARIKELDEKFDKIVKENEANRSSKNPSIRENANCMKLIMETGIRPGSEEDTKAKVVAYGATTLKGSHIVKTAEGVELRFVGKKGVALSIPVEDRGTANMLLARAAKAGPDGKIFKTSSDSLLKYSHGLDGGKFKTKDFRTYLGTSTAAKEMKNYNTPKTMKEYKSSVKAVATAVAKRLGNTVTVALQSYISPAVFSSWRLA